jgi:hypothetical protein
MPLDQSHSCHAPVRARDLGDPERLRLARPSLSRRKTASAKRNRSSGAVRTPCSHAPDARPVRVVGLPDLLSHRAAAAPACRPLHETDASYQSLQPTSCHEYPESHAIPSLPAFAFRLPRPSSRFRLSGSPAFHPRPPSAALDCHCWRLQPWIDRAVGAAAASCCRTITPEGIRGVPRSGSGGRFRPRSSPMARLADAPCRCPWPVPGIPSPSTRARTCFPAPQPKDAASQAQGAFHQQVPPSSPRLAPERRPHGPPLVPWLGRQGPSFRHAFTPQPEER